MADPRRRSLLLAAGALALVWLLALAGFLAARHSKVTAETVSQTLRTVDLSRLSGRERAEALRELARQMNSLSLEERRQARRDPRWRDWFEAMTEEEKSAFVEATLPTGFKQMLAAFEQLSEEKRKRAVADAMRRLKKAQEEGGGAGLTDEREQMAQVQLSEELQKKIVKLGLKAFYSDSSAQTKAELAPLLEELQRTMERGVLFRR